MKDQSSHPGRIGRLLPHALYGLSVLALLLLPAHKYAWMRDFDAEFAGSLPEDGSGNRVVVATMLLVLAIGAETYGLIRSRSWPGRATAGALAAVALIVWIVKFGGSA